MGDLIELFSGRSEREALSSQLDILRAQLNELDAREPEDMDSEEYEQWGQLHENLEDQIDDIMDLLDEI